MTRTFVPEKFLLADTGSADSERILIFGTKSDLARLFTCETWLADSTFKVAPKVFSQVWVICGLYKNRVVPFVYVLMPNKTERCYKRALDLIIDAVSQQALPPAYVMCDYEKAEINAFEKVFADRFPNANTAVIGCFFHFGQCIWRKIQALGLATRCGEEIEYNLLMRQFIALAFVKLQDLQAYYGNIADRLVREFGDTQAHQDFLEYMENTWLGRPRRNPLFAPQTWNCKARTELNLPRTNNGVEAMHHALQGAFKCSHPNFFKLLHGLLEEQKRSNAVFVKLQGGEEVPLYTRKEYKIANDRLLKVISEYGTRDATSYLAAIAHHVQP